MDKFKIAGSGKAVTDAVSLDFEWCLVEPSPLFYLGEDARMRSLQGKEDSGLCDQRVASLGACTYQEKKSTMSSVAESGVQPQNPRPNTIPILSS